MPGIGFSREFRIASSCQTARPIPSSLCHLYVFGPRLSLLAYMRRSCEQEDYLGFTGGKEFARNHSSRPQRPVLKVKYHGVQKDTVERTVYNMSLYRNFTPLKHNKNSRRPARTTIPNELSPVGFIQC